MRPRGAAGARFATARACCSTSLSRRFRRRAAALGVRTNPAFAGTYDFHDAADFAALFPRFLDRLPDGGVVMCHPGFVDAELRRLDPLTTLREQEYAFFAGDAFPDAAREPRRGAGLKPGGRWPKRLRQPSEIIAGAVIPPPSASAYMTPRRHGRSDQ